MLDREFIATIVQNRDHTLALLSGLAAALAVLLVCAMWIWTDWPSGAGAAVMVAIACSFFASQDNPAPAIASMLRTSLFAMTGVGVYCYAVLPRIYTFEGLCMALLPAGMLVGVLISRPATFMLGMNITATGATQMALENGFTSNFTSWANNSIAVIVGLSSALVTTLLIRSFGAAWTAQRLMRASWREIANAAEADGGEDSGVLIGITVDRLGLILPRLAGQDADPSVRAELGNLRVGLDIVGLHREQWRLPPSRAQPVTRSSPAWGRITTATRAGRPRPRSARRSTMRSIRSWMIRTATNPRSCSFPAFAACCSPPRRRRTSAHGLSKGK